jgi:hypothetical protein
MECGVAADANSSATIPCKSVAYIPCSRRFGSSYCVTNSMRAVVNPTILLLCPLTNNAGVTATALQSMAEVQAVSKITRNIIETLCYEF